MDLALGTWSTGRSPGELADLDLAVRAESLGYDTVWVAEAYGSDAVTVLSFLAGRTERIGLGAGVLQVPARSPAATAMAAVTLDRLSAGRVRLGLGVSGPQVSEGWHGVPFAAPLERLREYVDAVRLAIARNPMSYPGRHVRIPPPGSTARAIRLSVRPLREAMPIHLAAVGPRALELVGETGDGWLASFADPAVVAAGRERISAGRARAAAAGPGRPGPDDPVDVVVTCPLAVVISDGEHDAALDLVRPYAALYVGGMGGPGDNVYTALAARMGYDRAAAEVQRLYLSGRRAEAAAALPAGFVDAVSLIGTVERIARRIAEYAAAGATALAVLPFGSDPGQRSAALEAAQEALERSGVAT
jgi:F420-dependent oxidoreductase-like protein